jgi:hypothetical protein
MPESWPANHDGSDRVVMGTDQDVSKQIRALMVAIGSLQESVHVLSLVLGVDLSETDAEEAAAELRETDGLIGRLDAVEKRARFPRGTG